MIKLSIFTSLIANYTSNLTENEPCTIDSLVTNEPSSADFLYHSFERKVWEYKKKFKFQLPSFFILLL
jgi:hypothetical protein